MGKAVKIRSMFVAPPDKYLLQCDLSQAEGWVTAWLAEEERMKHSLLHSDIHTDTAAGIFDTTNAFCLHEWNEIAKKQFKCSICGSEVDELKRYLGKKNNHANNYGMGPDRQAQVINMESDQPPYLTVTVKECIKYQEAWHSLFPGIGHWHSNIRAEIRNNRVLYTPYRRKRTFYGAIPTTDAGDIFKEAYSYIPQSTVADHFTGAIQPEIGIPGGLKAIYKKFGHRFAIVNMAHDSFLMEVDKEAIKEVALECKQLLTRPMVINGSEFTIPTDAEYGERYGELEKVKP